LEFVEDSQLATNFIKKYVLKMFENLESEIELNKALTEIQYNTKKFEVKNHIEEKLKYLINEIFDENLNLKEEILIIDDLKSFNNLINQPDSVRIKLLSPKNCIILFLIIYILINS